MSNNLTITRGDTQVYTSLVTGSPDKALAGSAIRAMFRRTASSPALITKTLAGGGFAITSDVPGNRAISMTYTPADTSSLKNGDQLQYDVEITYADGVVRTVESGTLTVVPERSYGP